MQTFDVLPSLNPVTKFEAMPNELISMCFGYFDFYCLHKSFSSLNQRFQQLMAHQAKLYINLNSVPDQKFLTFCFQLHQFLATSPNSPVSLETYDEQQFSLLLMDDLFQDRFSKLKSLSLADIKVTTLFCTLLHSESKLCESLERLDLMCDTSVTDYDVESRRNTSEM